MPRIGAKNVRYSITLVLAITYVSPKPQYQKVPSIFGLLVLIFEVFDFRNSFLFISLFLIYFLLSTEVPRK